MGRDLTPAKQTYMCNTCGKGQASQWALDVHVRTHTGEKPYRCHVCDYGSAQKGHLKRHMLGKHLSEISPEAIDTFLSKLK